MSAFNKLHKIVPLFTFRLRMSSHSLLLSLRSIFSLVEISVKVVFPLMDLYKKKKTSGNFHCLTRFCKNTLLMLKYIILISNLEDLMYSIAYTRKLYVNK